MVLVDTSVWIDFLKRGNHSMEQLLYEAKVACHEFIIGELAAGSLQNRDEILSSLKLLPAVPVVSLEEYLFFTGSNDLPGRGVGFVDLHLLASCRIAGIPLWTRDKKLKAAAEDLKLSVG